MWEVLRAAMGRGKPEVITVLAKNGLDVNVKDTSSAGQTALIYGIVQFHNSRAEVIEALIKNGADVNASDDNGTTALMAAAAGYRENLETIALLLKNGADVAMKDKYGKTAMDYAERRRNYSTLKILENHSMK